MCMCVSYLSSLHGLAYSQTRWPTRTLTTWISLRTKARTRAHTNIFRIDILFLLRPKVGVTLQLQLLS